MSKQPSISFLAAAAICCATAYAGDLSEAVNAQNRTLSQQRQQDGQKVSATAIKKKLKDQLISQFYRVYIESKKTGLKVANPANQVEMINQGRKNSGVWELGFSETQDGGMFGVLTDTLTDVRNPAFSIQGYGLISASGKIIDANIESKGGISNICKFEVSIGSDSREYACAPYMSGKNDAQVINDMKAMITKYIKEYHKYQ